MKICTFPRWLALGLGLNGFAIAGCAQNQNTAKLPVGVDLQFGGTGSGVGQFANLRDISFDARGQLITLEGNAQTKDGRGEYAGNNRVQIFDANGQFLRQFDLQNQDVPAHIAGDDEGIYISYPQNDRVDYYDKTGRKTAQFAIPGATGLTPVRRGNTTLMAAIGGTKRGKEDIGGDRIVLLDGARTQTTVSLSRDLDGVVDFTTDATGNFYALAETNSIYQFGPDGKLGRTLGAGTNVRANDGSEARLSLAVDGEGSLYSFAGKYLTKYAAQGGGVTRRTGEFSWFDPWGASLLATDGSGRLWAAVTSLINRPDIARYHYRPVVMRLDADFFEAQTKNTLESSQQGLGLNPRLVPQNEGGVAYDLSPFQMSVVLPAAARQISQLSARYQVFDVEHQVVGSGQIPIALRDGAEARTSFSFTPPRFGPYTVDVTLLNGAATVAHIGAHVGVTPPFPNLSRFTGQTDALPRVDIARQMFVGLPAVRLDARVNPKSLDDLDEGLKQAQKLGATAWVQFTEAKDASPENVRAVVSRFKGRVAVYEIVNEPDLKMKAEAYLDVLRPASRLIRQLDPNAKVMGPACVNIKLPFYETFFAGGGAGLVDIVSFHDYEGNESIDEVHWKAKIAALKQIMARYNAADKPLWQTERAIGAVRANIFAGVQQAVRIAEHVDVLQELGIPIEHNMHYYLNEMGYDSVPTYLWSKAGPHPAAFMLRTRYALTKGATYGGTVNFGSNGNTFLRGLIFQNGERRVLELRAKGTSPQKVRFLSRQGAPWPLIDTFGNQTTVTPQNGVLEFEVGQLPIYVIPPGIAAEKISFGPNIASRATFSYSGTTKSDFALLNNGVLETIHNGLPGSTARGNSIWKGDLPNPGFQSDDTTLKSPPTLNFAFTNSRPVATIVVRGVPSDNSFCALQEFDIEARIGNGWQMIAQVRSERDLTEDIAFPLTAATTWATDTRDFIVRLERPITAREFRLAPRRVSFGVAWDARAARAMKEVRNVVPPPILELREIEIYGPTN